MLLTTDRSTTKWSFFAILILACVFMDVQCKSDKIQKKTMDNKQWAYFSNPQCYQKYFKNDLYSAPAFCYVFTISRLLSLITILLAFIIKIPQIYKIWKQKSVYGISYFGCNLQFIMYSLTASYGIHGHLPLSVYVENVFLSLESLIIILLFFKYEKQKYDIKQRMSLLFFACFVSLLFVLQMVPQIFQKVSIWLQLLVFIFGRGSQLLKNYQLKSTGNLSILMMIITIFCNISRVFSIAVQTPEQLAYLLNYLLPFMMNSYILFQFYLYDSKTISNKKNI